MNYFDESLILMKELYGHDVYMTLATVNVHGLGENIGNPLEPHNKELRAELRNAFISFYDKHVNENDKHTCILKIKLSDAFVFANSYKYVIDFENKTAAREEFVVDIAF